MKSGERHFAKDMKAGKKHAMQHPLQFRAIHVNNCFLLRWKCTAGEAIFLADKKEKLEQASDRLSKDQAKITFFLWETNAFHNLLCIKHNIWCFFKLEILSLDCLVAQPQNLSRKLNFSCC